MEFFKCPKKEDNQWLSEKEWEAIAWTEKENYVNAALPHHMWNWKQNDRPWPLCKQFRGNNAYGPRAGQDHPKYLPELPRLIEGRGISRWMASGDTSVAEVPELSDYGTLWTPDILPEIIAFFERRPGHPDFGKLIRWSKKHFLRAYAPSSLQKFSDRSFLRRFPYHISHHYMLKRREEIGKTKDQTGPDTVAFYRHGYRWDSLDRYYVRRAFYVGLRWN